MSFRSMATLLHQTDNADRFLIEGVLDVDLAKAGESADDAPFGEIRGIVSSEHSDEDGEVIVQDGIDWGYFLEKGKLTYGHPARPDNVCGEPTSVSKTVVEGEPATQMVGRLFRLDPLGKAVWDKACMLQKSGARARLGLSIEGIALERDAQDPKKVLRSKVYTVAVDAAPKNHVSLMDAIAASLGPALTHAGLASFRDWVCAGLPELGLVKASSTQSETVRDRLLAGVPDRDLVALRVLRRIPDATWSYAVAVAEDLLSGHELT